MPRPPLTLRLIVSRVCNACGQTLAVWQLLTNAPAPALLTGLYVYLAMLEALGQHSIEDLRRLKKHLQFTQPDTS